MFRRVAVTGALAFGGLACLDAGAPVAWPDWGPEIGTVLLLGETEDGRTWSEVLRTDADLRLTLASPRAVVYALGFACQQPEELGVAADSGAIVLDDEVGDYLRPPDAIFRVRLEPESEPKWEPILLHRIDDADRLRARLPPFGEAMCSSYRVELLGPKIDSESLFAIPLPGEEALVHLGPDRDAEDTGRFVRVRRDGSAVGFRLSYDYAKSAVVSGDSLYLHGATGIGQFVRTSVERLPADGEWDAPELPLLGSDSFDVLPANPFDQVCGQTLDNPAPSARVSLDELDGQVYLASSDGSLGRFDQDKWQGLNVSTTTAPEDPCLGGSRARFTVGVPEQPRMYLLYEARAGALPGVVEVKFPDDGIEVQRIPAGSGLDEIYFLRWVDGLGLVAGTTEFQFLRLNERMDWVALPGAEFLSGLDRVFDIEPDGESSFLAAGARAEIFRFGIAEDIWTGDERSGFCAVAAFDDLSAIPSVVHLVRIGDRWLVVPQDYFDRERRLGMLVPDACSPGARFAPQ